MLPSPVGLAVVALLILADRWLRTGLLWPLFVSLAFGATAFATLPALGGASPMIYTLITLVMISSVVVRRDLSRSLRTVFVVNPACWLVLGLIVYVIAGAYILPRLFMNDALVYVAGRKSDGTSAVVVLPLGPLNANLTQAGYLTLGALAYYAVSIALLDIRRLAALRLAALSWAAIVAATGIIDLIAGSIGLGDVFEPLRTAAYTMMTSEGHAIAGFKRINGIFSEASAYAGALLSCLAFVIAYWRVTAERRAFLLVAVCTALLILSTSTTAYVAAAACAIWMALGIAGTILFRGQIRSVDLLLLGCVAFAVTAGLAAYLLNEALFTPVIRLLEITVFNKSTSDSAIERGAWNALALKGFFDTWGLGVGIGSTRASSWLVAVISHLGIPGSVLVAGLVILMVRGLAGIDEDRAPRRVVGLARGCRAGGLASLLTAMVSAPYADPGIVFFLLLAGLLACRHHLAAAGYARSRALSRRVAARRGSLGEVREMPMPHATQGLPARRSRS